PSPSLFESVKRLSKLIFQWRGRVSTIGGNRIGLAPLFLRMPRAAGYWNFSPNKSKAKGLLRYLSTRDAIGKLMDAGQGFDVPPFEKLNDFGIWAVAEPPKGTLYNFPPRGEVIVSVAGYPAPVKIGVQMYSQGTMCKMIAQCTQQGRSIDQAIAFGEQELEGYMRT